MAPVDPVPPHNHTTTTTNNSGKNATRKRKLNAQSEDDGEESVDVLVRRIEQSSRNLNDIARLMEMLVVDNDAVRAVRACSRVFLRFLAPDAPLSIVNRARKLSKAEEVAVEWIRGHYKTLINDLLQMLRDEKKPGELQVLFEFDQEVVVVVVVC